MEQAIDEELVEQKSSEDGCNEDLDGDIILEIMDGAATNVAGDIDSGNVSSAVAKFKRLKGSEESIVVEHQRN